MKAVILAGGYGTRISEESHLKPKPMIEIGGMPILWHIMKIYSFYGITDFIICCGYKQEVIKQWFANYFLYQSNVTFDFIGGNKNTIVHNTYSEEWRVTVVDTGLNTMTGGRIKRIQDYIGDEPFLMTYGDGVGDININSLLEKHKCQNALVTLTAVRPQGRFGIMDLNGEKIVSFREKSREDTAWINGGFMVMEPSVFDYIDGDDISFEKEPLERIAAEGKLYSYRHEGFWQCMDTMRDKELLDGLWNSGNASWKIWRD